MGDLNVAAHVDASRPSAAAPTVRSLSTEECYRLLATQSVGRLGVINDGYPLIFPVNYGLDHGIIVIRTSPGTKLRAAEHANICFEVDEIDPRSRSGWSVLIRAAAEEVTPAHGSQRVAETVGTRVEPWVGGEPEHWIRLIPHGISGRRIVPDRTPAWFEPTGYL